MRRLPARSGGQVGRRYIADLNPSCVTDAMAVANGLVSLIRLGRDSRLLDFRPDLALVHQVASPTGAVRDVFGLRCRWWRDRMASRYPEALWGLTVSNSSWHSKRRSDLLFRTVTLSGS